MSFKKDDIVTFKDGSKVIVLDAILFDNNEYLYTNELENDSENFTNIYKVLVANYSDGSLVKVTDSKLLSEIVPVFEKNILNYIKEDEIANN